MPRQEDLEHDKEILDEMWRLGSAYHNKPPSPSDAQKGSFESDFNLLQTRLRTFKPDPPLSINDLDEGKRHARMRKHVNEQLASLQNSAGSRRGQARQQDDRPPQEAATTTIKAKPKEADDLEAMFNKQFKQDDGKYKQGYDAKRNEKGQLELTFETPEAAGDFLMEAAKSGKKFEVMNDKGQILGYSDGKKFMDPKGNPLQSGADFAKVEPMARDAFDKARAAREAQSSALLTPQADTVQSQVPQGSVPAVPSQSQGPSHDDSQPSNASMPQPGGRKTEW